MTDQSKSGNRYKVIEELGLKVRELGTEIDHRNNICNYKNFVSADDLFEVLEKGVRVYTTKEQNGSWLMGKGDWHEFSGLIINIQPIENPKPVEVKELVEMVSDLVSSAKITHSVTFKQEIENVEKLLKRIEKDGISNENKKV